VDHVQVGVLWQLAMSIGWTQGPLQTPFDQWHAVAVVFTRQSSWVVAVAQSTP
jgi:hypothetical protein